MTGPEPRRSWVFGIDLWMTAAALVLALLMIILATSSSGAQTLRVIRDSNKGQDGGAPRGRPTSDRAGNPYGTTSQGSVYDGQGTWFFDSTGNPHGTTNFGRRAGYGHGMVWQITP